MSRFLARAARERRRWGAILLDPPTFSAARGAPWSIEKDYPTLIARACDVLEPDGFLWLASNTREVSLPALASEGVRRAGRDAALLEVGGLPPDYPTVPVQTEDRYLQVCLFAVR